MSITQFIHRGKHMYGERTAFVFGQRATTFTELYNRVARTASLLRELDPSNNAFVGILTAGSDHAITTFFASSWAGNTLMALPLFHVSGILMSNSAIMFGNTLHILPAFDPVKVMQTVQEKQIAQALLIPTMLQMVVNHPSFADHDLSSLRYIRYGGSPIDQALLMDVKGKLPGADLMQVYGQTECVPATFLHHIDHGEAGVASGRTRSAGTPCLGVEIVIRDEAVAQCAVVGLADKKWGEKVHAEIVLKPGASLMESELADFCRDYLAGYKVPKSFQTVETIPLTAVGKVDKVAIRKLRD